MNVSYQRIGEVQVKRRSGDAPPLTAWSASGVAALLLLSDGNDLPVGQRSSATFRSDKDRLRPLGRTVGRRSSDQRGRERRPNS